MAIATLVIYSSNWDHNSFASIEFSQNPEIKSNNSTIYIGNSLCTIKSFVSLLDVHSSLFSFILWLFFGGPAKVSAGSSVTVLRSARLQRDDQPADKYFSR